jgi:hypothetical protein
MLWRMKIQRDHGLAVELAVDTETYHVVRTGSRVRYQVPSCDRLLDQVGYGAIPGMVHTIRMEEVPVDKDQSNK